MLLGGDSIWRVNVDGSAPRGGAEGNYQRGQRC